MFIMNADLFGGSFYLNVLGHEFRHMIEDNHDRGDADWDAEGFGHVGRRTVGLSPNRATARQHLPAKSRSAAQQLVDSNVTSTTPYYGQGYLAQPVHFDRLGADLYRQFATSPGYGLQAVDEVAAANGLDLTGEEAVAGLAGGVGRPQ